MILSHALFILCGLLTNIISGNLSNKLLLYLKSIKNYFFFLFFNSKAQTNSTKKIVCYYTSWSQYRPGVGRFVPQNIDPFLCTHIIYAFAKLDETGVLQAFEWNDQSTEWSRGMYDRTMDLRKKNKDLKILLAAGGWFFILFIFVALLNKAVRKFQCFPYVFIIHSNFRK